MSTRDVKLVTEHTHNGVKAYPGHVVTMDQADAEWYAATVVGVRQELFDTVQKLVPAAPVPKPVPVPHPAFGDPVVK